MKRLMATTLDDDDDNDDGFFCCVKETPVDLNVKQREPQRGDGVEATTHHSSSVTQHTSTDWSLREVYVPTHKTHLRLQPKPDTNVFNDTKSGGHLMVRRQQRLFCVENFFL